MQVDLPAAGVAEHVASWQPGFGVCGMREAVRCEPPFGLGEVLLIDRDVQVGVRAGLLAEQGVDAPTAVQPEAEAGQGADNLVDVVYPDRLSFPCFLACNSPRRKTQIPSGTETTPMISIGQMSPQTPPTLAPLRIAERSPRSA